MTQNRFFARMFALAAAFLLPAGALFAAPA